MHQKYLAEQARRKLIDGNQIFINAQTNPAGNFREQALLTAQKAQTPYAAILTCSDSRVPPEHIFSAGIGDIFVIRTAGNVVGDFALGSIEFAVDQLHVPLVMVMGHTQCAAVAAALLGDGEGYMAAIIREIRLGLNGACTEAEAVRNNIRHGKQRILQSSVVKARVDAKTLMVIGAEYDLKTGQVHFGEEERGYPANEQ